MPSETAKLRRLAGLLEDMGAGAYSAHVICAIDEIERLRNPDALSVILAVRGTDHAATSPQTQAFDAGVDFALRVLAEHLDITGWKRIEETDSYHSDLSLTFEQMLATGAEQDASAKSNLAVA